MNRFIYVFNNEGRDVLLSKQYQMLKSDEKKHVYVFLNKDQQDFACDGISYALSNTLTF